MPEGYIHVRCAKLAAKASNIQINNNAAFCLGANGPDMLFSYKAWRKPHRRGIDIPAIGGRLHDENTGALLKFLLENAKTDVEKEYVLGFLSHYATDCTVHPYVVYLSTGERPYDREGGHAYCEIAMDSTIHMKDTGSFCVYARETTPVMKGKDQDSVCTLFANAIKYALGEEIPLEEMELAFKHANFLRTMFVSPTKIKYGFCYLLETKIAKRGYITGHITPARLKEIPDEWVDPFTGKNNKGGLAKLLKKSEELSAKYMQEARKYWDGKKDIDSLMKLLGSRNYLSGLEDDVSLGIKKEEK